MTRWEWTQSGVTGNPFAGIGRPTLFPLSGKECLPVLPTMKNTDDQNVIPFDSVNNHVRSIGVKAHRRVQLATLARKMRILGKQIEGLKQAFEILLLSLIHI